MNSNQRIGTLINLLDLLYQKLGAFEEELIIGGNAPAKFEVKQRIYREILPDIRRYESEYWSLVASEAMTETTPISETEAEKYLSQMQSAMAVIEQYPAGNTEPLSPLLQTLRRKLALSGSASSRLKIAIPLIPTIATYEIEMNAGQSMSQVWNALRTWIRK